ncbi:MAG: ribosomal protein L7/L12 [Chloroflexi bacterium]|nr:ribosomal protein L7/L12 [Chloroflexota bacterium]
MGQLLQAGNKIEAIKIYRQMFGVGLKEAKDAVERLETTLGTPGAFDLHPPEVTTTTTRLTTTRTVSNIEPSGTSSRGCLIVVALLIVAAVVAWFAFNANGGDNRIVAFLRTLSPTETAVPTRVLPATEALPATPAPTDIPKPTATPELTDASILVGDRGTLPGQFNDARSIGLDEAGNIYVGEYVGGRIQVFDESGTFITQWRVGDENGFVRRMTVAPEGIAYVVYNGNILKYEGMTGDLLGQIDYDGGQGFQDVAVTAGGGLVATWNRDWQGGLFVNFNESQDDIVIFDAGGNVVNIIGKALSEAASGNAELDTSVAVDGSGNIYASGSLNPGIFKFSPEGKFLDKFGEEQAGYVQAMAIDFQSRLFASASGEILIFDAEGRYLDSIDASPGDMVFNEDDVLYTIDDPQVIRYVLNR